MDATGITQAIDHLGEAAGLDLHAEQVRAHRTNAAVLHGRVFGAEPLSPDTVLAAFVDGARVRAETLARLAAEIGGDPLRPRSGAARRSIRPGDDLPAAYEAQEQATLLIAAHARRG